MRANANNFTRSLSPVSVSDRNDLNIPKDSIAYRLNDSKLDVQTAGFVKGDIIVAFDGKRQIPYRVPHYYPFIDHKSGDVMSVTVLRAGKEKTLFLSIP